LLRARTTLHLRGGNVFIGLLFNKVLSDKSEALHNIHTHTQTPSPESGTLNTPTNTLTTDKQSKKSWQQKHFWQATWIFTNDKISTFLISLLPSLSRNKKKIKIKQTHTIETTSQTQHTHNQTTHIKMHTHNQ